MKHKIMGIIICMLLILSTTTLALTPFRKDEQQAKHQFFDTTPVPSLASNRWIQTYGENITKNIFTGFSINTEDFPCYFIEAKTSYEYGYKVGKILGSTIKTIILLSPFIEHYNQNKIQNYTQTQISYLKKYFPYELEEFEGLSDCLHIKIEKLIFLRKLINSFFLDQCTVTLSTGKATKDNQTFLTQNFDPVGNNITSFLLHVLFFRFVSYNLWIVKVNTMRYTYAFFGIPLLREFTVLNEKGLAHGGNGIRYTSNLSQPIDEGEGLSLVSLRRLTMMICANITDVVNVWKTSPRESNRNDGIMTVVYCDAEGNLVSIESTHSYFVAVYGNSTNMTDSYEDILWHTNHFLWLNSSLTGSIKPEENPGSVLRYKRCKELLEENYGNITLEICQEICRDHCEGFIPNEKDSADICMHPEVNAFRMTAYSYIVLPNTLTIYYTHHSPCKSRYVCRNLTEPLTKSYSFLDRFIW